MKILEMINKSQQNLVGIPTNYKITHITAARGPELSNFALI